jgi:hypothetical protein
VTDPIDRLDEIKDRWSLDSSLPRPVPWGFDDVVWLVGEVERLRAEAKRADEEATTLANSDLATTEQVIRSLRADNERLRKEVDDAHAALAVAKEQSPYIWCEKHDWEDVQPCIYCSKEGGKP